MSRILLINPNCQQCPDVKFLLHLNGYQIETCETIDEGINRFQIFQELDRSFDLVLLVADGQLLEELEKFAKSPFSDKLMIINEKRAWGQGEKSILEKYPVCAPKSVLDGVKSHLKKAKGDTSDSGAQSTSFAGADQQPRPKTV